MDTEITFEPELDKNQRYHRLLPQLEAMIAGETNLIANLANISAALSIALSPLWCGFYIRQGDGLVLGPFQGPPACTRIPATPKARGVCGQAAAQQRTLIVPDVEKFSGHIACSALSRSEIVVPLVSSGRSELVLDIDSEQLSAFDQCDAHHLELLIELLKIRHFQP